MKRFARGKREKGGALRFQKWVEKEALQVGRGRFNEALRLAGPAFRGRWLFRLAKRFGLEAGAGAKRLRRQAWRAAAGYSARLRCLKRFNSPKASHGGGFDREKRMAGRSASVHRPGGSASLEIGGPGRSASSFGLTMGNPKTEALRQGHGVFGRRHRK